MTKSELLSQDDLKVLKAPFPRDRLGVKVQSLSKNRDRAMLVLYLQHTDVQNRLEEIDPSWTSLVLAEDHRGDTVYIRMRMTVKGVSRENVGDGGDPKSAYSDALKRCAMLFGVGRYLYDSVTVWTEYQESRDRFRDWSLDDYESSLKGPQKSQMVEVAPEAPPKAAPRITPANAASKVVSGDEAAYEAPGRPARSVKPGLKTRLVEPAASQAGDTAGARPREQLNRILMSLYRPYLTKYPDTQFVDLLQARYNVRETRLMTVEQIEDLVQFMEVRIQAVA